MKNQLKDLNAAVFEATAFKVKTRFNESNDSYDIYDASGNKRVVNSFAIRETLERLHAIPEGCPNISSYIQSLYVSPDEVIISEDSWNRFLEEEEDNPLGELEDELDILTEEEPDSAETVEDKGANLVATISDLTDALSDFKDDLGIEPEESEVSAEPLETPPDELDDFENEVIEESLSSITEESDEDATVEDLENDANDLEEAAQAVADEIVGETEESEEPEEPEDIEPSSEGNEDEDLSQASEIIKAAIEKSNEEEIEKATKEVEDRVEGGEEPSEVVADVVVDLLNKEADTAKETIDDVVDDIEETTIEDETSETDEQNDDIVFEDEHEGNCRLHYDNLSQSFYIKSGDKSSENFEFEEMVGVLDTINGKYVENDEMNSSDILEACEVSPFRVLSLNASNLGAITLTDKGEDHNIE